MKRLWQAVLVTTLACSMLLTPTASAVTISLLPNSEMTVMSDEEIEAQYLAEKRQYSHEDVLVTELPKNVVSASEVHDGYISVTCNLGEWGTYSEYTDGFLTTTAEDYESLFGHPIDYSKFTEIVYEDYVTDDFRSGFIDVYGNQLFPFSAEYGYGNLSEGLTQVYLIDDVDYDAYGFITSVLYGYVNTSGNLVIPMKYNKASDFKKGFASVTYYDDAGVRHDEIIDKNGNTVLSGYEIETYQTDEPCVISKDGKYGLATYDGNILIEPFYDSIREYTDGRFQGGLAEVTLGDKRGYVNMQGELVFDVIYDDAWFFSEDKIWVGKDGKYAIINSQGEQLTEYIYEKFVTISGTIHHEKLEAIGDSGTAFANLGYSYVYLDENAKEVYRSTYNNRYIGNEKYSVNANGDITYYPVVNGEYMVPSLENHSGLFRNYEEYISYEYHRQNPQKYGYKDVDYNAVLPIIYEKTDIFDKADDFNEGYAVVKYNNRFCVIRNPLTDSTPAIAPTAPETPKATPNASKVLVDGKEVAFEAYTIDQNNYFKLRDIAQMLSGTEAQFEVNWDNTKKAINITTDTAYTPVGGELVAGDGTAKGYVSNNASIYLNGEEVSLTAYTINQNNYFKLRDLGQALGFNVSWDGTLNTIVIASNESYTAD